MCFIFSCGAKKNINRAMIYVIFLLPVVVVLVLIIVLFYKALNNGKSTGIHVVLLHNVRRDCGFAYKDLPQSEFQLCKFPLKVYIDV